MVEFLDVKPVDEARRALLAGWFAEAGRPPRLLCVEDADLSSALGRVLARAVVSPEDVPADRRSTVDGFAVAARDTFGASEALPAMLEVIQDVAMGRMPEKAQGPGQASRIPTGGVLPEGADTCVMVEHTELLDDGTVLVERPSSPGENVVQRGEDVARGETVLGAGRVLSPFDIGALASIGVSCIPVVARPRVAVISTGDEIVPPGTAPCPSQVRDINNCSLSASVRRLGAEPVALGIAEDTYPALRLLVEKGLEQADMVAVSGGSSVGARDVAVKVFSDLGPPGVLVHGVAVKPGKPVILAVCRGKPVFGLPGHPVSALTAFDLFVRYALNVMVASAVRKAPADPALVAALSSSQETWVDARLSRSVSSAPGREDHVRVRLVRKAGELLADPVLGKSSLISIMVGSDGEIVIPPESEGLIEGTRVQVRILRG